MTNTDDPPIDLFKYGRLFWARRFTLLGASLLGLGISLGAHYLDDQKYLATARLYLGQTNSSALSEAAARYRTYLADAATTEHVEKQLGLAAQPTLITAARIRSSIVTRMTGGNVMLIDVRLPEPELAERVADAVARRLVEVVTVQDDQQFAQAQATSHALLRQAEEALLNARTALVEFRSKNPGWLDSSLEDQRVQHLAVIREMELTEWEIRGTRARLEAAAAGLAKTSAPLNADAGQRGETGVGAKSYGAKPEEVNPSQWLLALESVVLRTQLAGLESKRNYLRARLREPSKADLSPADLAIEQAELQSEVNRALRLRDELSETSMQMRRSRLGQRPGLEYLDQGVESASLAGLSFWGVVVRGLGVGALLGAVGIVLVHILWHSPSRTA